MAINTYLSFKRVTRFSSKAVSVARGMTRNGKPYNFGLDEEGSAFLVEMPTRDGDLIKLKIDFSTLIESLVSAEAAEAERWEELVEGPPDFWGNDIISAHVRKVDDMTVISYHRRDRAPIRDWRIGQKIKNQLVSPEAEGVELYPAESRMVDTSNEYWLFCVQGQFPVGFQDEDRLTQDQIDKGSKIGRSAIQRDDPDADTSRFSADRMIQPILRVPKREEVS